MATTETATERKQKSTTVPYDNDTLGYCQCGNCPTHKQCKKNELAFCSSGASDNVKGMQQKGCQCPTCQVFENFNLGGGFFCIEGEAK